MRTTVTVAALLAALLWAAPAAQAKLVYVKGAGNLNPVVYVARDSGKQPRRVGVGRTPTISPDGRWVAFVTVPGGSGADTVVLQRLGSGSQRLVMRSRSIAALRFSADSRKLAAIAGGERVRVYDIARDNRRVAAEGHIRGFSFAPGSKQIVYANARRAAFDAPSDLYVANASGRGRAQRLTRTRDAVNPVWGPEEILFDRFEAREGDAPAYNLWAVKPAGGEPPRELTDLTIPPLVSGLVPLEISSDARRALAVFTGQNTEVGFTVATRSGQTRALSRDFETGLVGFDLSADGRRILGHTGGWDPSARHDVVSVPYGGGEPEVLVADAAYPDWNH